MRNCGSSYASGNCVFELRSLICMGILRGSSYAWISFVFNSFIHKFWVNSNGCGSLSLRELICAGGDTRIWGGGSSYAWTAIPVICFCGSSYARVVIPEFGAAGVRMRNRAI